MLAAAAASGSRPAQAQEPEAAFAVAGGWLQYDLSGTGDTFFGAVRVEMPLSPIVLLEPGLTFSRYEADFGSNVSLLFPEMQIQLQGRGGVSPYIGMGAGPAFAFRGGWSDIQLSLSAALGLRVRIKQHWRVGGELRIRAVDPFAGTTAEWGLGISRRFK
jgi:outer membrane protein with beta-barrel domain